MYLFLDTETNGLPKNFKAPADDLENWPRIIQLAWAFYDENGELKAEDCTLIKPDGWEIPKEEFWLKHGYTTENNLAKGEDIVKALSRFEYWEKKAKFRIAHNMAFDSKIVRSEFIRAFGKEAPEFTSEKVCTMMKSTSFCQIPGKFGFKWPNLTELHTKLFGEGFDGAHDAMADVKACARCFFELKKLGVI